MRDPAEYRRLAEECRHKAEHAPDSAKADLRKAADSWDFIADQAAFILERRDQIKFHRPLDKAS